MYEEELNSDDFYDERTRRTAADYPVPVMAVEEEGKVTAVLAVLVKNRDVSYVFYRYAECEQPAMVEVHGGTVGEQDINDMSARPGARALIDSDGLAQLLAGTSFDLGHSALVQAVSDLWAKQAKQAARAEQAEHVLDSVLNGKDFVIMPDAEQAKH